MAFDETRSRNNILVVVAHSCLAAASAVRFPAFPPLRSTLMTTIESDDEDDDDDDAW